MKNIITTLTLLVSINTATAATINLINSSQTVNYSDTIMTDYNFGSAFDSISSATLDIVISGAQSGSYDICETHPFPGIPGGIETCDTYLMPADLLYIVRGEGQNSHKSVELGHGSSILSIDLLSDLRFTDNLFLGEGSIWFSHNILYFFDPVTYNELPVFTIESASLTIIGEPSPVPLPAGGVLFLSSMIGLAGIASRKRKALK